VIATIESGKMTKDLAICAHGPSAPRDSYLMTQPFMDAVRREGAADPWEPPPPADRPLTAQNPKLTAARPPLDAQVKATLESKFGYAGAAAKL